MTSSCGDGYKNTAAGEQCDTSGTDTSGCNAGTCKTPACGDSYTNMAANEDCDDGNQITELCMYGNTTGCTVCDSTCHSSAGGLQYCGDGTVQPLFNEVCDDTELACGSCAFDCKTFTSAAATGQLSVLHAASLDTGTGNDTFTLDDGLVANSPVTFEYVKSGSPAAGNIAINIGASDSANSVRDKTVAAINGQGATLRITAAAGTGAIVNLTNDFATSLGNQTITKNVNDPDFAVSGMAGGKGGDCAFSATCRYNLDCEPTPAGAGVCAAATTCQ
jgi:hypothetical protein